MKAHEQILKMIEEVSPDDTAKLYEINGRVFCYIKELDPLMEMQSVWPYPMWKDPTAQRVDYTRSRDALKSIRPEGYMWTIECRTSGVSRCEAWSNIANHPTFYGRKSVYTNEGLPTEELAELHAIIQAIAYERGE